MRYFGMVVYRADYRLVTRKFQQLFCSREDLAGLTPMASRLGNGFDLPHRGPFTTRRFHAYGLAIAVTTERLSRHEMKRLLAGDSDYRWWE